MTRWRYFYNQGPLIIILINLLIANNFVNQLGGGGTSLEMVMEDQITLII